MKVQNDLSQLNFTLQEIIDDFKKKPINRESVTPTSIGTIENEGIQIKLFDDESRNLRICLYEERNFYSREDGRSMLSAPQYHADIWVEENQKKESLSVVQLRMIDLVEAIVSKHFENKRQSIAIKTIR